jgi:hypothetical protein
VLEEPGVVGMEGQGGQCAGLRVVGGWGAPRKALFQ